MIQPRDFRIRRRTLVILSAALGVLVAAAGYHIADNVERAHAEALRNANAARLDIARSLLGQNLRTTAGRLEELAGLPLLEEFFDANRLSPHSGDTAELNAYIKDVFAVSIADPAFDALVALSPDGTAVVTSDAAPAGDEAGTRPPSLEPERTLLLQDGTSDARALWLQTPVPPNSDTSQAPGFLLAKVRPEVLKTVTDAGIRLTGASAEAGGGKNVGRITLGPLTLARPTPATRNDVELMLYAGVSGLCVFLVGLGGALLIRDEPV